MTTPLLTQVFATAIKTFRQTQYVQCLEMFLAQIWLESNRCESKLSTEYNNSCGLKYRKELAEIATPAQYTDWSNENDAYCRFKTIEDFVIGYILFIERSVYDGQMKLLASPTRWMEFLISRGFCTTMAGVHRADFKDDDTYQKYLACRYTLDLHKIRELPDFEKAILDAHEYLEETGSWD